MRKLFRHVSFQISKQNFRGRLGTVLSDVTIHEAKTNSLQLQSEITLS